MKQISTIFNQLLDFLPKNQFQGFIGQHKADRYVKNFTCWQQLLTLLYAQATGKDSLRDIELGLLSHQNKWYHLGLTSVTRSNLSYANKNRPYRIYESMFYELLKQCRQFCPAHNRFSFENPLYSMDATVMSLCLSVFPWAKYRKTKGALKLHVLLNNRTAIPEFAVVNEAKIHEINIARNSLRPLPSGSILVFDKAYIDYRWFSKINKNKIFFVSRTKKNTNYFVIGKNEVAGEGVLSDEVIGLGGDRGMEEYTEDLRLITYYDRERGKKLQFITNNFELSAKTIADIYKDRWQIELFFKWIKQNLKIKSFLGTSKNAVLTQIWVAMIYYLLLIYIKFKTQLKMSLLEFTRIIKELFMMRIPLISALGIPYRRISICKNRGDPQLSLF
ncbi:IS4 family transposase [Patescibacteria group bacterium]|nr:IS4 family transposase [Patescibacteria group bacterium]MBU1016141.1 IS4 family transposase [Patescibacteria group bacterium]MBU1684701.1 IS4 family transposase [Patescibacteria group bacterium]MBU1938352.1 IS4 family transposase [Patescibacteria group bacterium]